MTNQRSKFSAALTLAAVALPALASVIGPTTELAAQRGPLVIGGGAANFGIAALVGGFLPDPSTRNVTSGGSLDASAMSLAPGCRGFVTAQPDVIVRYSNPASFLRFFVRAPGDTTLVVNDAQGRWYCDDDSGGNLNPMVDINNPGAGQYDVWIGSYRAGENITGQFAVTELRGNRP